MLIVWVFVAMSLFIFKKSFLGDIGGERLYTHFLSFFCDCVLNKIMFSQNSSKFFRLKPEFILLKISSVSETAF